MIPNAIDTHAEMARRADEAALKGFRGQPNNPQEGPPAHTPEPWGVVPSGKNGHAVKAGYALSEPGAMKYGNYRVATVGPQGHWPSTTAMRRANAARIVGCVNACAGVNPEAVPGLVASVASALDHLENAWSDTEARELQIAQLKAALAKAKGK